MNSIPDSRGTRRFLGHAPLLLVIALVTALSWGQQASQPGDASSRPADTVNADASRAYVPSLFGRQPIAVDLSQAPSASNEPAPPVAVIDSSEPGSGVVEPWAPYVRNPAGHYLLYGMTIGATYQQGDVPEGTPAWSTALSPYLGLMGRTRTGFYTLQYAPSIMPYIADTSSTSVFHNLAFDAAGNFSRRLAWHFDLRGGYGEEISRLTGNLNSQSVTGGVALVDTSYASVQAFNGKSENVDAAFGISYQLSRRDTVGVSVNNNYYAFISNGGASQPSGLHSNDASLGLEFGHSLSDKATLKAYASESYVFSNFLPCNSFGGGLGLGYRLTPAVSVDVGAGPATGCGAQGANYHGTLTARLPHQISLAAGGAHQLNTAYRLNSRWEDDLFASASRRYRSVDLGMDAGYFHGQSLGLSAPSQGYFISPRLSYALRLTRFTSVSLAYRRFHNSDGGGSDISFVMMSLIFSPNAHPLGK